MIAELQNKCSHFLRLYLQVVVWHICYEGIDNKILQHGTWYSKCPSGVGKELNMNRRTDMNLRKRKNKRDIILNTIIIVVFALIVIVGANIVFGGSDTAEDDQNSNANSGGENSQEEVKITESGNGKEQSQAASSDQEDSDNQDESESSQNEDAIDRLEVKDDNQSESNENDDDSQEDQKENESDESEKGPNEDNIGEPIGTSQNGEHTSSYEKGSVDWNEKIKAIQMATGMGDGMTLWRLQSGGGPQKAVGKVSPEGEQSWMYVVNLQWVDQEGWKVTNVNRQSR